MKQCLIYLVCSLAFFQIALAQERSISGSVTSSQNGSALPDVSVIVKGSNIGTTTDKDGRFQMTIPANARTLVFSYIGYTSQETPIGNGSTLNVKLTEATQTLTDVVVTAAGIKRQKGSMGYSVSTLQADKIAQKSEPDPLRALTGKVAGVNVQSSGGAAGGATNITIRGNSSLGNNNQPLFVVDGVPFDNSSFGSTDGSVGGQTTTNRAFDLDPNNIQSMTVLKGAAASALYGSRAANGAIIITTKAGNKKSRKGLEISYTSSYSIETVSGLPNYQTEYGQGTNFDYRAGVYGSWGQPYRGVPSLIPTRDSIPHQLAIPSRYPAAQFPQFYKADGVTPIQVPYQSFAQHNAKNFFRTGNVFDNAISISSGSEKANFTVGLSRMQNQGIVPENEITRTSVNVGGNAQLENKIYVSGSLNYVNTDQVSPQVSAANGTLGASIMDILLFVPTSYDLTGYPTTNPLNGNNVYDRVGLDNPYWSVLNSPTTSKVDRYYGNFIIGFDPFTWLNIQNTVGLNAYTQRNQVVNGKGGDYFPNGNITNDNIYRRELDNTLLATATTDLTKNIGLKVILGNNVNQRLTERNVVFGDRIIFRGINSLNNTAVTIPIVLPNNRNNFKQSFYAFFADVELDYKKFAFLNLVGRNDVSSTLPPGNRSYLYGGVNGSFIFTEAFDMSAGVLSYGKIRAGYTKVGNEATPYQTVTVYQANPVLGSGAMGTVSTPFNGQSTLSQSDLLANANLKPEFITELEIGTELQFFNSRIALDMTYYRKISTSQIFTVNAAPSTGYTQKVINLGKSSNEGVEIGLDLIPIKSAKGFNWTIATAFTLNRNIVEDIGSLAELNYGGFSDLGSVHIAGLPYGMIRGSTYAKDSLGNVLVNPNTGKPILSGRTEAIGNPNPDFILGVTNSFRYKNFALSVLFDWKQGGDMYSFTAFELLSRGVTKDIDNREAIRVGPGVLGDVNTLKPILDGNKQLIPNNIGIASSDYYFTGGFGPGGAAEVNVFDATVFRLREVSLGYTLPERLLSGTPFGSASLSFSGRNLWYLAPNFPEHLNFDPETSSTGSGNSQGFDFIGIPSTRRYGLNLRVSF